MDDRLTKRHELCKDLYDAGLQRNESWMTLLMKELRALDKDLPVPDVKPSTELPKEGDMIYVPSRGSISHGYDDVKGGVGVVMRVKEETRGSRHYVWVTTHEQPGRAYNWEFLSQEQADLKTRYSGWAHPDPDLERYEESW